jgi:hypothetical protein
MNPFEYVNAINSHKDIISNSDNEQLAETGYNPWMVNKAFSYFKDTILYANSINEHHFLDKKLQFHYLLNSIRPQKRFAKWVKKQDINGLEMVKEYYGYSNEKALQALALLSPQQLDMIKQKLQKGG